MTATSLRKTRALGETCVPRCCIWYCTKTALMPFCSAKQASAAQPRSVGMAAICRLCVRYVGAGQVELHAREAAFTQRAANRLRYKHGVGVRPI